MKEINSKSRIVNKNGNFSVYIVECKDGTYYTGYTSDLERRLGEHHSNKRGAKYTRYNRPVNLVWKKEYRYLFYVMRAEYRIKQLNRKQKGLLVRGMRLDKVLSRKHD